MDDAQKSTVTRRSKRNIKHTALLSFVGVLIFGLGWGLGSGSIDLRTKSSETTQTSALPANLDYREVEEIYDTLKTMYDGELTAEALQDGLKAGLAKAAGDPYTQYLTEEETKEFDDELSGSFTGIGAELSQEEDAITVVAPIAGYPAEKAGLRAKDVIVEIDGKPTYDMSVTEAVKLIRGPKGSVVKLTVVRDKKEEVKLEITRDEIMIPSVEYKITDNNIGIMTISRFGDDTVELAQEAATQFKSKNVKGVIVDVRNNPGGYLDGAVDVASLWLNDKTVLTERRGDVTTKTFTSDDNAPLAGIPTIVLINEGSASASEILAGALKDNDAATLVGAKSFGKGSVQQLDDLRWGGTLKVTIARWYTPDGKNIDKEGITPDETVKIEEKDRKADRDPQLDAATEQLQ